MEKLRNTLNKVLNLLAGLSMTVMVVLTTYQVIVRYIFNSPSTWSEELVGYLFGWSTMLGATIVSGERGHMNIPVLVPGGADIAMATSELMKHYQAAIWAQHGLFASGPDFDITFGLAHTIEKSAEIYVKVLSMGGGIIRQTITDDDLRAIARDFGVTLNEKFLN